MKSKKAPTLQYFVQCVGAVYIGFAYHLDCARDERIALTTCSHTSHANALRALRATVAHCSPGSAMTPDTRPNPLDAMREDGVFVPTGWRIGPQC